MLSLTRASQGRFHEQIRFNREAVFTVKQAIAVDLCILAFCYVNLSFAARDSGAIEDLVELELVDSFAWPESLRTVALEIDRSRAWLYALRGDDALALELLERLIDRRSQLRDGYWLALLADAASIERTNGESTLALEIIAAAPIAETFTWSEHADQRFALSLFALALSYIDAERADGLLALEDALGHSVYAMVNEDRRSDANRAFRIGVVDANTGRREEAFNSLADAFEIWVELGQRWQATTAAIEPAELGLGDDRFLRYARREALSYPNSRLMRRVLQIEERRLTSE